ncbi:MAG: hypothetical protein CL967_03640 [Euryarchaeota archaeon]|nr:hypothetical protein [Euryarchaeota archaeon]
MDISFILSVEFIKRDLIGLNMENSATCPCGVEIDVAGATPRKDGLKIWCKVCGNVFIHHRK